MKTNIQNLLGNGLLNNKTAQEYIQRKTLINQAELDKAKKKFYDLIEQSKKSG